LRKVSIGEKEGKKIRQKKERVQEVISNNLSDGLLMRKERGFNKTGRHRHLGERRKMSAKKERRKERNQAQGALCTQPFRGIQKNSNLKKGKQGEVTGGWCLSWKKGVRQPRRIVRDYEKPGKE